MEIRLRTILFLLFLIKNVRMNSENYINTGEISASSYVVWQNATIPFYIMPEHFDHDQTTSIMTTLALFAFKTCLKFVPVLAPPSSDQHVMLFANPNGVRKCVIDTDGHSLDEPHTVILGYDCLQSPKIDRMLMKALGFPFEHNRASRDIFIDVLFENIDPSAVELFTKDTKRPLELQSLAYDIDSVMHFGEREYSKNGHRTIIFRDYTNNHKQNRNGLSALDLRKIELVYGPECRRRDRQEKLELCQNYPGVARRKREVDTTVNLRVNRDITPPPKEVNLNDSLIDLGIENEVQSVVDEVYKVSAKALKNARAKYCNDSKPDLRVSEEKVVRNQTIMDILGIVVAITDYAQNMVDNAIANLTEFCAASENIELYQRLRPRCPFYGAKDCPMTYRSTKSGAVKYSTQHRPVYKQPTRHVGGAFKNKGKDPLRAGNDTEDTTDAINKDRRKRDIEATTVALNTASVRRHDDDFTTVIGMRNDDERDVQARRDATRVINVRSKDEDATTVARGNGDRDRKKGSTPSQNDGRREDTTGIIYHRSQDKTTEKTDINGEVTAKDGLRAGTDIPGKKSPPYVVEWPVEEKPNRRYNKLGKAKARQGYDWNEDSKMSMERSSGEGFSVSRERTRITRRKRIVRKERMTSRQMKRPQRQRKPDPEDVVASPRSSEVQEYQQVQEALEGPTPPITVPLSKANKEFYSERKWPDGIVRYVLVDQPEYDMADVRRRLDAVNAVLKAKTCARLSELSEGEARRHQDHLVLDTSADFITGRVGGRQHFGCLELFRGGQHRQHAAMLVMAMLGFYFELARHDRDRHVRVHLRHVRPDKLHHFEKIRADATFPLAYDYESATHPAWQFWRKLGKTGISTVATYKSKDPDGSMMKRLGQHEKLLSELDLVKINSVYGTECFRRRPSGGGAPEGPPNKHVDN